MKEIIINEIQDFILNKSKELQDNKLMSAEEKLVKFNVYLDVFKFLKNYDENVKILNEYYLNKKFRPKPNERDFGDDDRYNY